MPVDRSRVEPTGIEVVVGVAKDLAAQRVSFEIVFEERRRVGVQIRVDIDPIRIFGESGERESRLDIAIEFD